MGTILLSHPQPAISPQIDSPNFSSKLAGNTLASAEFWRGSTGGGWATAAVLLLLLGWQLLVAFSRRRRPSRSRDSGSKSSESDVLDSSPNPVSRVSSIISDADLRELMNELDAKSHGRERWEDVIEKKNGYISYSAKCCRPKDGPLKYLSITTFERCSTELLRDFYMDNEYRKDWDKTLVEYRQLQVDETSGTEIGCMIKKFPLLTPREYVLAWRVWEGNDKTFYCVTKNCEHSLAPRLRKYVRVGFLKSSWCIRKVPGRDACEIIMVHQEDAGLNVEMAKMAFTKGVWSYVCKMNNALREYSSRYRSRSTSVATMLRLVRKVPPVLEIEDAGVSKQVLSDTPEGNIVMHRQITGSITSEISPSKPSKTKLIANGLLLLGGVICLSRGRTALGTQLAIACILKKIMKHAPDSATDQVDPARISRARRESRQRD